MNEINDKTILRLINNCVASTDAKSSTPFQTLLSLNNSEQVSNLFIQLLQRSKEPTVKLRISHFYEQYMVTNFKKLSFKSEDIILNHFSSFLTETPISDHSEDFELFEKYLQAILCLLKETNLGKVFNLIITSKSPYSPLAIALISNGHPKLEETAIKFLLSQLSINSIITIYSLTYFLQSHSFSKLSADCQKAFTQHNGLSAISSIILSGINEKTPARVFLADLAGASFSFLPLSDLNQLITTILSPFLSLIYEPSLVLRVVVAKALSKIPEISDPNLFAAILPILSRRFEEVDDDYSKYVLTFIQNNSTKNSANSIALIQQIKVLLKDKETYSAGVIFSSFFFSQSPDLLSLCYPEKPNSKQALASSLGAYIISSYHLANNQIFPSVFRSLMSILINPSILDDLMIQCRVFQAIDSLKTIVKDYPLEFIRILLEFLPEIKGDDVYSHLYPLATSIIESASTINFQAIKINALQFSPLFVSAIMRYIEARDDPDARKSILSFVELISSVGTGKIISISDGANKTFVDLFDQTVPPEFVDAVRTEAILRSQQSPNASLIAVSLPNCGPFLPTLCRVVRELIPEDPYLTYTFIINASQRTLDQFIPHLKRFTEPVQVSSGFFLLQVKEKKQMHLHEVFGAISYIVQKLSPSPEQINSLLSIVESSFPQKQSLNSVMPEALSAISALANCDQINGFKWRFNIMQTIFSSPIFASAFSNCIKHCPAEKQLINLAANSYALAVANLNGESFNKNENQEEMNEKFIKACFDLIPGEETLDVLLNAIMHQFHYSSFEDPIPLLKMCLTASKYYRSKNDTMKLDLSELLTNMSSFFLSMFPQYRALSRDVLLSLYGLQLPADQSNPIFLAQSLLSPAEIVQFASSLFNLVFSQFSPEFSISFAIYLTNCKPFSYHHALLLQSIATLQASPLVQTPQRFIIKFFEVANTAEKEAEYLLIEVAKLLAKAEMKLFFAQLLSVTISPFTSEIINLYCYDPELRVPFLKTYSEIISEVKLPATSKEQTDFLKVNVFQALKIIVTSDPSPKLVKESFGQLISHLICWLSILFASAPTASKKEIKSSKIQLISTFDIIFSKLGRSNYEPIEFSLTDWATLYQSLGSLANALMMIDFEYLIDFCKWTFIELKSKLQPTVLTASLCLSRLLYRVSDLNSDASAALLPKLREAVAVSFSLSCDTNCKIMTAVMSDLFTKTALDGFNESELSKILEGSLRAMTVQNETMKSDSLTFLCNLLTVCPTTILHEQLPRLFDVLFGSTISPHVISALTVIAKYLFNDNETSEKKTEFIQKIPFSSLIEGIAGEDRILAKRELQLLSSITTKTKVDEIISTIKEIVPDGFNSIAKEIMERLNKSNVTEAKIDVLIMISKSSNEEFKEQLLSLLLSIIEDNEHPLREVASKRISRLFRSQ